MTPYITRMHRVTINILCLVTHLVTELFRDAIPNTLMKDIVVEWYTDENRDEENEPPDFHYQRSSVKEILGQGGLSNCLVLILLNVLFFTGAYVAFLRYDVR